MFFTNDIYIYMRDALIYQGYRDLRDVPIEVIKEEIKGYLMMKLVTNDESLDLDTLLKKFESYIDEKDKTKLMGNFIHYLLSYISILQGFEMVWYIENEQIEPQFKESIYYPGIIDGLVTNKKINYCKTFNYCLNFAEQLKKESRGRH